MPDRRAGHRPSHPLRFEHRHEPLLPLRVFYLRMLRWALITAAFMLASLGIGTLGYHFLGPLNWLDAMLNASMILAGMGPVDPIETTGGKWFAAFYAIFSGVAFLTSVGVFMAPLFHRLLHRFHLEMDERSRDST